MTAKGKRPGDVIGNADNTMRMHMRRFTRLTNGHSKKVANNAHMVGLYTLFYISSARIRSCG